MRATAAAISTLISSFVGLAAGPLLVGYLSDFLQARFAEEALRYSLLVPTLAPIFSAFVCIYGASAVKADLERAKSS
jgi:MFS family permease